MTKVTGGPLRLVVVGQVEHTIHSQYIPKYGMVCYSIEYCSVHRSIATQATRGAAALAGVGAGSGTPEATFVSKLPKLRSTSKFY